MWHTKKPAEIEKALGVNAAYGLTDSEARVRLKARGENILPEGEGQHWYKFLLHQFKSPLVYILLSGVVVTAFLREWVDAIVISLAVAINVAVGFWQEYKSNNILKELEKIVTVNALVTRDGNLHEIDAKEVVVGDIIHLKAGLRVPADARLIETHNLYVNQSALTGESSPDEKHTRTEKDGTPLSDRENMVYMGTVVSGGSGKAIVVNTGKTTEIGKIALLTQKTSDESTPLQKKMAILGKTIAYVVLFFAVIIFIIGTLRSFDLGEILITAIAVSVAGVPEGLPAAISIILAVSAQKILKKKGVVKNLLAAETLGSTTVICTDKTGTLTKGKMEVQKVVTEYAQELEEALLFANSVSIKNDGERQIPIGEPTDIAKYEYVANKNPKLITDTRYKKIGFMEFDSRHKILASVYRVEDSYMLYTNGAPEAVLSRSHLSKEKKDLIKKEYENFAKNGYRVIGVGYKKLNHKPQTQNEELSSKEIETLGHDIIFAGLVAIIDPVREDVKDSIEKAKQAGIRVIMATGDHKLTAQAISKELGIGADGDEALEGSDLDTLSDEQLISIVKNINIFSRVTPEHKIRIVGALQKNNEVVAMTGDGVNDSPALVGADIGIAVGSGTDIAKEASDLVLLNDSFSTIVLAIEQGRIAFENIRKVSVLLLTSSFSEIILIMTGLLIPLFFQSFELLPLPITALQILYVNLAEDTLPNLAMAFEPGEEDVMKRPPIKKNTPILNKESKHIIFIVGLLIDVVLVAVFLILFMKDVPTKIIQTTIFAAISIDTFFYVFSIKSLRSPIWKTNLFNNKYLLGALFIEVIVIGLAIYHPLFNAYLHTTPLPINLLLLVLGLAIGKMALIEVVKLLYRKYALA